MLKIKELLGRERKIQVFRQSKETDESAPQSSQLAQYFPEEVMVGGIQQTIECLQRSDLPLWDLIRFEATLMARNDRKAASMLYESVLSHSTFPDALSHNIASSLETSFVSAVQLREFILEMFSDQPALRGVVGSDILAAAMRDPSVPNLLTAFLFSKGLHAVFTYRISHYLWNQGRKDLALYIQSRNSQVFHADIHPAAQIGRGLHLGKGTNVVIGETAVIGKDCSISQRVTLGGTGKVRGDRHPKLQARVTIGVGATILGNIEIGEGAIITAESVVLKPVPAYTRSSGVPSKVVADISCAVDLVENTFPEKAFYVTNLAPGVGI